MTEKLRAIWMWITACLSLALTAGFVAYLAIGLLIGGY